MTDLAGSGALLESRVLAECEELARVGGYLRHDVLAGVIEPDLANTLRNQLTDCETALGLALKGSEASGWTRFGHAEPKARQLRAEIFALLQGQLFSAAGLDDGISAAARQLLEGIRQRSSVYRGVLTTFTPDPESVDHTIGLVRLKFPGSTVWDLPFAVHEFGHHAVRELPHVDPGHREERPLRDLVAGRWGTAAGLSEPHAQELMADAFATFALGATYPLACVVQRVRADRTGEDSATHPSWLRRLVVTLAVLERMSKAYGDSRYADTAAEVVRPVWELLTGAGVPEAPDQARLEAFATRTVDELHRHTPGLAYDDADKAVLIRNLLATKGARADQLSDGATTAAVVDAAWRWRRQNLDAPGADRRRVNELAIACCIATTG